MKKINVIEVDEKNTSITMSKETVIDVEFNAAELELMVYCICETMDKDESQYGTNIVKLFYYLMDKYPEIQDILKATNSPMSIMMSEYIEESMETINNELNNGKTQKATNTN